MYLPGSRERLKVECFAGGTGVRGACVFRVCYYPPRSPPTHFVFFEGGRCVLCETNVNVAQAKLSYLFCVTRVVYLVS